uniref:Histone H2A/H2B/H3 domain-containing protein n=1 Tax=Strigops habroptila TaxID=2489341 RepID=A0A672U234_STRHB
KNEPRKSRSRTSAAKKRKNSDQAKHRPMKKRRRESKRSLRFDAKKLKEAKGSGRFLSREAKGLMISFVKDIYKQVSSEAERLRRKSREAVVGPVHVQGALRSVLPKRRWKQVAFRSRH